MGAKVKLRIGTPPAWGVPLGAHILKPRETRRIALINGRLRCGASWRDVSILNVSTRGLLLHTAAPPERGTYVEVHRGGHAIVARVIWSKDQRFGVHTQNRLNIDNLVAATNSSATEGAGSPQATPLVERRSRRRKMSPTDALERSKRVSRAIEFVGVATFITSLGMVGLAAAGRALGGPLAEVLAAL
jgi:hypothetical protein